MKKLVLGSAGFIGSSLCRRLLDMGERVIGVDLHIGGLYSESVKINRTKQLLQNYPDGFQFMEADINKLELAPLLSEVDTIFNEAALPGLALSWEDFDSYNSSNLIVVSRVLEALSSNTRVHLVHASTSSVYGKEATGDEDSITNPISPYGVTKLAAEHLISSYQAEFGISAVILRYFSVFGPGQRPDMAYAKFIDKLKSGEKIEIFGDGRQTRANTYIEDTVEATVLASNPHHSGKIFNICGDSRISVLEAIETLADELGVKPDVVFKSRVPGDQRNTGGVNTEAKRVLNWVPKFDVHEGLRRQARWPQQ